MHQDPYGFMWLGTYDGLNLYDGKEVITFRYEADTPNSLLGNTIHNIASAGDSHLWIATQLGLNRFSLKEQKVVEAYPEYRRVNMIATDSRGNSWMIVKDDHVSYYDHRQKAFREIPLAKVNAGEVKSLFLDAKEQPCLVRQNGTLQYLSMEEVRFHHETIRQVFNEDGQLYFVDNNYDLFVYYPAKQQKMLLRNVGGLIDRYGLISSLCFFRNDVYIAFMNSGFVKLDMTTPGNEVEPINMTIGVFGILKDRFQNALWLGTDGQGVSMYYSEKDKFGNILLEQLPFTANRPIRAFYTDEHQHLWIGTKGDGIIRVKDYERFKNIPVPAVNVRRFTTEGGLYENPVYCFERSTSVPDNLWIGTEGYISYYSYSNNSINIVEDTPRLGPLITEVHALREVNDSTLWVASNGLKKVVVDKSQKPYRVKSKHHYTFVKDGNSINDEFYSILYDGHSKLFIGSRKGYGVIVFDINTEEYHFVSMEKAKNRAVGDIICLHLSADSVLYLGASSGLTQIGLTASGPHRVKQFNRNDGIINDMIHGIVEDADGIVWLSTNKGLAKYNPGNDSFFNVKSPQLWVTEYSDDAYLRCPFTNRLFFGGVNGLIWIEPKDETRVAAYAPDLLFTALDLPDRRQTLFDYNDGLTPLTLSAGENTFGISFSVLDYVNGDNYDYAYLLENYNDDWVSLRKDNKIAFTNLPPGTYVLKVKYKNDVVAADHKIYSLPITVMPPWYLSTLAYVFYALLGVLLAYGVWLMFRRKQQAVARRMKEEQKEKLYMSKMMFFTNVTHEFFTPLTLINGALEQIKEEAESSRLKKYVDILRNNVLSLNDLVQEVLDFRKIEEAEIGPYTLKNVSVSAIFDNLLVSFAEIAGQNHIELIRDVQPGLYWHTDRASFKKIVSNLVSNAFKYTPEGGTVRVTARREGESLRIVVYNTDIMMPEIDGLSFIQMLREDKYCKHLPIIALSARVDESNLVEGYAAGADAYVTKPFSAKVLLSMVNRFLVNKEELKGYYDSADSSFEYAGGKVLHQKDKEFIDQALGIMKDNISNAELDAEFIAERMKISSRGLNRHLKRILSVTPTEFIKTYKFSYAAKLLVTTNLSVKEVIHAVGFSNRTYFYSEFSKRYGVSPRQYRLDKQLYTQNEI